MDAPATHPVRCAFRTAADIRCRRDAGHDGAHDTTYIFGSEHDHFVALAMLHAGVNRETAERWQTRAEALGSALPDWPDEYWQHITERGAGSASAPFRGSEGR